MILFFTGTGNSKYCADFLADKLDDSCMDISQRIKTEDYTAVESEKSYIICVPTYAWRIPSVVTDFLKKTELKGNNNIYFVMTCGGQIGKAEKYNRELCENIGKNYKGTAKIKMAENYLAMFEVTDEKEEELLMKDADAGLASVAEKILSEKSLPAVEEGIIGNILSGIINEMFNKYYLKDDSFKVKDNCTSCGLCVKKCPLGNITFNNGKIQWNGNCTHCMACISYCPVEAIEYGKKSAGKRRYRCREYNS